MRALTFLPLLAPLLLACGELASEPLPLAPDAGAARGYATDDSGASIATPIPAPSPAPSQPSGTEDAGSATGLLAAAAFTSGLNAPCGVALDGTNVYWAEWGPPKASTGSALDFTNGAVQSAPLEGGAPVSSLSSGGQPLLVVAHNGSVYWTDVDHGTVMTASVDGGAAVVLASGQRSPFGIAVDDRNVYWVECAPDGAVHSVPLGGGSPVTIASNQNDPRGIAIHGDTVYWTLDNENGAVMSASIDSPDGGAVTTVASAQAKAGAIAVDDTSIYWLTEAAVMKVPLSGGAPTTLATGPGIGPAFPYNMVDAMAGIAVDASHVYWTDGVFYVRSLPLAGGVPTVLAAGQTNPTGIAVGATGVYWANEGWNSAPGAGSISWAPLWE